MGDQDKGEKGTGEYRGSPRVDGQERERELVGKERKKEKKARGI